MTEAAAIKATFADIQTVKSRNVLVLKFECPLEQADAALRALGGVPIPGTERWCGIARLAETAAAPAPAKNYARSAKVIYANKSEGEQAVTRAALLSKDEQFQRWKGVYGWQHPEEAAANYIRSFCGVESRREIAGDDDALERFKRLETSFDLWRKGYADA